MKIEKIVIDVNKFYVYFVKIKFKKKYIHLVQLIYLKTDFLKLDF